MRTFFFLLLILLCTGCQERRMIAAAKNSVSQQLKDPGAAQFRNVEVVRQKDGTQRVCGEVNAKNGFGAYVGFRHFDYSPENGRSRVTPTDLSNPFDNIMAVSIQISCAGLGQQHPK